MDVTEYLSRISDEADALARAAEAGALDARVPGCPDWDVEALLRHMGGIHRWAARIVRDRMQERPPRRPDTSADGADLFAWLRDGAAALVAALHEVSPEESFWQWGAAPSSQSFWARRQANETSMHRWDGESARGTQRAFATDVALDALDEWLTLSAGRATVPGRDARTLHFHATDGSGEWVVRLSDPVSVESGHARADCAVRGPASDLFLLAMNRRSTDGLEVLGDAGVLDLWREHVHF